MKCFFLNSNTMDILAEIKKNNGNLGQDIAKDKIERLLEGFNEAKIFIEGEKKTLDETAALILDVYFNEKVHFVVHMDCRTKIVRLSYFFYKDVMIMVTVYRDGCEFMLLPSIKMVIGSIADLIYEQPIGSQCCEEEGNFFSYCNEGNYQEVMLKSIPKENYQKILLESDDSTSELWAVGEIAYNQKPCFIYVKFVKNNVFFYRQEDENVFYGSADRPALVNILSHWMLYQHRNLIINMYDEDE